MFVFYVVCVSCSCMLLAYCWFVDFVSLEEEPRRVRLREASQGLVDHLRVACKGI